MVTTTAAEIAPVTTMASAMLFGTITFTTVALYVRFKFGSVVSTTTSTTTSTSNKDGTNDLSSNGGTAVTVPSSSIIISSKTLMDTALNPRSTAFDYNNIFSIYTLLYHSTIFGLILFYAYLCEYHPPFAHATKTYDRDTFFFYTACLFVASYFTIKNHLAGKNKGAAASTPNTNENTHDNTETSKDGYTKDCLDSYMCCSLSSSTSSSSSERLVVPVDDRTEVLNRDQTEEWKGWMQFMFLLYHYFHAEEVYNSIRIMITCYVWMTGFGNFSFFYIKGDYSFIRIIQMLWRLNFLVLFLCLTQGTTYILYYICLLHTYFFLMVYVVMRIGKEYNYTKWGLRIKLLVLALIIYLIWDVDTGIFKLIHYPFLGELPQLGATSGALYEWYFRSSLDHWSTFLGMVFALNFPITSLFFRKLEAQTCKQHFLAKFTMGLLILVPFIWWVLSIFNQSKLVYNKTNAYYGCIPLLTYIYFRNITPYLRGHTLDLLHQIGKTTLETYLMQHHIWLTSDAKSLLTLIPGWPKMNFLLVSILYVIASRKLYTLTLFLRGMILPDDKNACIRNLGGMTIVVGFFVGLAYVLQLFNILNLVVVFIVIIGCGLVLYTYILSITIPSTDSNNTTKSTTNVYDKATIAGAICVLLIGIVWNHSATTGSGKIKPLPASCSKFVQSGSWIPVDSCNENTRGVSYRDYNSNSLGTCSTRQNNYVWGWNTSKSSELCRFQYKDKNTIGKQLKHRNILFVGDSIVRHVYFSFCRQMGDVHAGAYNATIEKHGDFNNKFGTTTVNFIWAPYVMNVTSNVDIVLNQDEKTKPDIIILGGGPWDRLHLYNTEDEQTIIHNEINVLANKLVELNSAIPVTWIVPTIVNTWALPSEDKRTNINEESIQILRTQYEQAGINSYNVSFVLDGRTFTTDRIEESYDGVHYPLTVYDAGAQILVNAFDWLLLKAKTVDVITVPQPNTMDNPKLGMYMLLFVCIGIIGFDGFMGASYIAAIFVPSCSPKQLYYEAFSQLHSRLGLCTIPYEGSSGTSANGSTSTTTPISPLPSSTTTSSSSVPYGAKSSDVVEMTITKDKYSDHGGADEIVDETEAFIIRGASNSSHSSNGLSTRARNV